MIGPLIAALLSAGLPEGGARYRAELGGTAVGVAEFTVTCDEARCLGRYSTQLRLPAESGGGVERVLVVVPVGRDGRSVAGVVKVERNGVRQEIDGIPGAVPASLLEVVLAAEGEGCVRFYEEERPEERTACARREGEVVAADVGGVRVRVAPGEGGFPREVEVAGRFRFVRDPAALLPARPPQIAGTSVPGPADFRAARTFCGIGADRAQSTAPSPELPPPRAPGASCRDKTRAWLAAARARGFDGRAAVGIAWDGASFVWHEWAEVRVGGAWLAVDPSFRELPARGPRFTIARFREDDPVEREAAGGRIITCWGRAVE